MYTLIFFSLLRGPQRTLIIIRCSTPGLRTVNVCFVSKESVMRIQWWGSWSRYGWIRFFWTEYLKISCCKEFSFILLTRHCSVCSLQLLNTTYMKYSAPMIAGLKRYKSNCYIFYVTGSIFFWAVSKCRPFKYSNKRLFFHDFS